MALDLVQVRWQQIRMTEACQLIETENIALKKEIKELKEKLATSAVPVQAPNLNAGEEKFAIRRSCATMRNTIMRFQSELVKLKLTSVQEINWLVAQKQLLSNAFNRYVSLYNIRDAQYEAMEYARDQLQERLDGAQQDLRDGVSSMSQEHDKMKLKYKNARTDLINAQEEIIRLKELAKTIEEKYTLLTTAKAESDAHYNVLNKEYLGMQALVDRTRAEGEDALDAANSLKRALQESYEKIVGELGYENEYLRKTCAEQEEQIARLTNTLIGNKSHFARYVEVKTENLTLQSKLEAVTKSGKRGVGVEFGAAHLTSSAKAATGADVPAFSGLPAHQRRHKGSTLANAGASAVNSNGLGGGGGAAWSSAVRQPSPRMEPPPEVILVSSKSSAKPPVSQYASKDTPANFVSSGIQMMFPVSSSSGNSSSAAPFSSDFRTSPQTSPRPAAAAASSDGGHHAPRGSVSISKVDSTTSLHSHASTLAEPNVLPPPATILKPVRSSYAGGAARLYSPRNENAGGSRNGSRTGSSRSPRAALSSGDGGDASEGGGGGDGWNNGVLTPVSSAHGRMRGNALSDSRRSPMSSPRGMQAVGKTDSLQSMLAEPIMLPPPATALQPALGLQAGMFAISEGSSVSRSSHPAAAGDSAKSTSRKSMRLDAPLVSQHQHQQGGGTHVAKIELSFGTVGRPRVEKQVI